MPAERTTACRATLAGEGALDLVGGDPARAVADSVDRIVAEWHAECPDLNVAPIEKITEMVVPR